VPLPLLDPELVLELMCPPLDPEPLPLDPDEPPLPEPLLDPELVLLLVDPLLLLVEPPLLVDPDDDSPLLLDAFPPLDDPPDEPVPDGLVVPPVELPLHAAQEKIPEITRNPASVVRVAPRAFIAWSPIWAAASSSCIDAGTLRRENRDAP
jgi:hypothetical protein